MRQFLSSSGLDKDNQLTVSGKDFRYLVQVLRLKTGDCLDVRLSGGSLVSMSVALIQNKSLVLQKLDKQLANENAAGTGVAASEIEDMSKKTSLCQTKGQPEFYLFQFLTKPQKMDIIIRQATETGVSVIVPIQAEFSPAYAGDLRQDRWERVVREARQQSGSPVATKILPVCSLDDAMKIWQAQSGRKNTAFAFYEEVGESKSIVSGLGANPEVVAVAIGCEGGISSREIKTLCDNGFLSIHLETNILRAETAALYALAAVRTVISEYAKWHVKE